MAAAGKKAQITVFVIIAILIVSSVGVYFVLRPQLSAQQGKFSNVEQYFLDCMKNKLADGARILGEQGGYIQLPEFQPGSDYMPFSSQLNFFGNPVPYWFYISGNNIMKEQIPSKSLMEKHLGDFLEGSAQECDFSPLTDAGYEISAGEGRASVSIKDTIITADLTIPLDVGKDDETARITSHKIELQSKIGKFYNIARKIYDKQNKELFLENYTLDMLSLYVPYTNVEVSCAPKIWQAEEVEQTLKDAIEANVQALKFNGNYYQLASDEEKYFVVGTAKEKIDERVNFLYSGQWPTRFEVTPNEDGLMRADPTGTEQGLGILGFCFVQYHFIYDIAYPVLVQVMDDKELFQFPVVVSVDKNKARDAAAGEAVIAEESQVCKYKLTDLKVTTQNSDFKPLEADIGFKCFTEKCDIGRTRIKNGSGTAELIGKFPQCINGFVQASAEGYADAKLQLDTNEPALATLILQPLFNLSIEAFLGGAPFGKEEQAIITFETDDMRQSIAYPAQKTVSLKEGFYNVSMQVYQTGKITIGEYNSQQCTKVPATGIGGLFGLQKEQCYDITLPSQTLTQIIVGGGNTEDYFTENMLKQSRKLKVTASVLPTPQTIVDLQQTYELLDVSRIDIALQ